MKIFLPIILSLLLISKLCYAQDDTADDGESGPKRFAIGFSVGNGYPMGEYGSISASRLPMSRFNGKDTDRISGYAKPGFHYDIHAACRIIGHLSIMVSFSGDQDSYDMNALNAQYDGAYPPNTVSIYTSQQYYLWQILGGPQFDYPISKVCSIDFHALAGYTGMFCPALTYNGLTDTVTYSYPLGSGFGYSVGAGISYNIATGGALGVAFHLNTAYNGAIIKYADYSTLVSNAAATNAYLYNYPKYMNIGLIEVSVGISLEF